MVRQDMSVQQVEQMTDTFKGILEENGGKVVMVENWGLRTLAYKIKKSRKAHYVRLNIDAPHAAVAEMERRYKLMAERRVRDLLQYNKKILKEQKEASKKPQKPVETANGESPDSETP